MGIFDFFRKKKPELQQGSVALEELEEYLNEREANIKNRQESPRDKVKEDISTLITDLEDRITILENLDLKDKKALEREKLIVKQNLDNFVYHLEKLTENLKELDLDKIESLKEIINSVDSIFQDFEKKSLVSFQKSTYLIGEELGAVKENISKFFKSFNETIKENKDLIEEIKIIPVIKEKLKEVLDLEKNKSENQDSILDIQEKIRDKENEINNLKKEKEELKGSKAYHQYLSSKQELEKIKTQLAIELPGLKELIDFKILAKIYHSTEKQMNVIKEFRERFKESLEKYGSDKLMELVDTKEIDQERIKDKLKTIDKLKDEISKSKVESNPIERLEKDINQIRSKMEDLISEKIRKEKLDRKFKDNKKQVSEQLEAELKKININLN